MDHGRNHQRRLRSIQPATIRCNERVRASFPRLICVDVTRGEVLQETQVFLLGPSQKLPVWIELKINDDISAVDEVTRAASQSCHYVFPQVVTKQRLSVRYKLNHLCLRGPRRELCVDGRF